MELRPKDETIWIVRLTAFVLFLLVCRSIVVLFQRIFVEQFSLIAISINLAGTVFLSWLTCHLLRCSSLWSLFSCLNEIFPFFQTLECQYFRINKHIRSGMVAGITCLVFATPIPFILSYAIWIRLSEYLMVVLKIVCYPLRWLADEPGPSLQFFLVTFYLFGIGFIIGFMTSYLTGKLNRKSVCRNTLLY